MNLEQLKAKWNQLTGKIKEEWGDLTDNEILEAEGKAEQLSAKLQEKYGKTKEEADKAGQEIADALKD